MVTVRHRRIRVGPTNVRLPREGDTAQAVELHYGERVVQASVIPLYVDGVLDANGYQVIELMTEQSAVSEVADHAADILDDVARNLPSALWRTARHAVNVARDAPRSAWFTVMRGLYDWREGKRQEFATALSGVVWDDLCERIAPLIARKVEDAVRSDRVVWMGEGSQFAVPCRGWIEDVSPSATGLIVLVNDVWESAYRREVKAGDRITVRVTPDDVTRGPVKLAFRRAEGPL